MTEKNLINLFSFIYYLSGISFTHIKYMLAINMHIYLQKSMQKCTDFCK